MDRISNSLNIILDRGVNNVISFSVPYLLPLLSRIGDSNH